ncbi:protein BRI1-5 ENHANCED 1-like [Corylus avellana]|uniref:protein BRI1-5 ENHANCED 1-like n=1 Tax=Corylus avellana TaxID=13451 RepID=UPI00286D3381|nr:protein BRI1-5 ENHANCED 1-like [Corylus avellana]
MTCLSSFHLKECKKDISYLTNLPLASKKLQIFHADLNQPDSFDTAIEGCVGVFHLAHPMDDDGGKEREETVTERAMEGMMGILKACLKSTTVKRVIYTSSAATILFNNKGQSVTDENTWSDLDICRNSKLVNPSYLVSKIMTERLALEFAEENGLDLVTLVLPVVVGPFICPTMPSSVSIALAMILGEQDLYAYLIYSYMVHIEDVANALIFLLECPNAKGRYICSSAEITIQQMHEFLSSRYQEFQMPKIDQFKGFASYRFSGLSSMKLLESGFEFKYGVDEMFDGAIQCCKEKGFL